MFRDWCSDENTSGIFGEKSTKWWKNNFQTSTTSTLLVTGVPAMTTTAASAGDYVTFSFFLSHLLICFENYVTFSYFPKILRTTSHFPMCLENYITFTFLPKQYVSHFIICPKSQFGNWKLKHIIFSGTSNASDGGVAITTWRHLNIVDPLH